MDWNGQMLVTFWSQCRHFSVVIQGEEASRVTAGDATRTLATAYPCSIQCKQKNRWFCDRTCVHSSSTAVSLFITLAS